MIVRNALKMKFVVMLILCAILQAGATVAIKMYSFDEGLAEGNLTKPRIYIKNVGTEAIANFTYRYYFTTEGTEVPIVEDYWTPNESVTLVSLGNNHYYVKYALAVTLNPGQMSPENSGCVIGIHYNSWGPWDKTNDCSNTRTTTFVENPRIEVYNSSGTRIYGDVLSCSMDGGGGDTLPPQDMALNSFALFSTTSTKVQANTFFTGGGALGSNGEVEVGAGSQVTGNIVSGQNAILRANAVVNGDVFAENTITTFNGTVVKGICHENAQVAELTIPQKTVTNGTVDKTISSYTTITLSPGNYKNCTVQTNGTLILLPGLYTFYNLNVQKKGKVQINAASNQLVQVDITADLEFYDSCEVKFQTHGYSPAVRFYTNDANTIRIGYGAKVIGILSAPLANLTMYAGSRCDGAIYAKQITIEQGASMTSEDVNIETDADGDGVPNGVEILSGSDPASSTSFKLIAIPHPGVIDNTVASTITYDLARFSPEYASNGTATLAVPARALKNGVSNVLMKVSNKPVDFDGSVVTGSQLPSTSNYATRFFSFKSGIFMPSAQITLTVPIVANDIGVTNYSYDYYNDATNSWVTGSAPEMIEVEGVPSFRLTMTAPKILVVHEKITSDVAYLDGGTILTSSKEMSDVAVDFNITGVASDAIALYQIHYDDYSTTPASPKEFHGSFSLSEIDGVSSLQSDFSEGSISSTAKIIVNRVVITSSENITYDYSNTEYTVLPGQRVTLKADAKPVCYATSSGRDPVAVLYDNNYVLESFDLDGEGRIKKSSAGTGFTYDYFIRDNLGSTRMVVNDNGDVREANMYMGYGKIVPLYSQNGYSKVRDKFTGKEFDTESGLGLFYFGARYYDPDLGLWTSPDPMDQYWNAYSYCGADPVNTVDEWGLSAGNAGVGVSSYSLSMSDNATSLSAEQGVTWGATDNSLSLSNHGLSVAAYSRATESNLRAYGEVIALRAYYNNIDNRPSWDGKFDLPNPEVPRAKPIFAPFFNAPPLEKGEIEANPLLDPFTGLAAAGLKLGAKAGAKAAAAAATLARDAGQQLVKVGKNVIGNNAAKSAANSLDDLAKFRQELGLKPGQGTLSRLDVGGKQFYGINAHGQNVTLRVNPISKTHAEADAFQQAANAGASSRTATLTVDRALCGACGTRGAVKSMARQINVEKITVVTPRGTQVITP